MRTSTRFSALLCTVLAVLWAGCTKSNTSVERGKDMLGGVDMATPDLAGADLAGVSNDLAGDLATSAGDLAASDLGSTPVDIGMCTPNAFAYCEVDGRTAVYCNASGTAGMTFDCGVGGCLGPSGCGQCTADSCANGINGGSFTPCDTTHQKAGAPVACETLASTGNSTQCASPTACGPQCTGAFVCGDGSSYGTATNSSYACTAGTIGAGTAWRAFTGLRAAPTADAKISCRPTTARAISGQPIRSPAPAPRTPSWPPSPAAPATPSRSTPRSPPSSRPARPSPLPAWSGARPTRRLPVTRR